MGFFEYNLAQQHGRSLLRQAFPEYHIYFC